ncbi:Pyridoxal-5'-phosphate-dependent enzyme, beta subunit [Candidatus Sulfopaludibacter sp. SbA3]|nr:Pyridoxal-5'-phosphate-dependent enzyme, beta subunit [Candidatus Sulfopaludibacter sp. SbA3]
MTTLIPGPTYEEMLHLSPRRAAALDELDPANLFHISWRGADGGIRCEVLPKELTGIEANLLVMVGRDFPSGSHKVGPAYATLMEGELAGEIAPGVNTIIGPSTGNFGIGTAYVSRLKGYSAVVIMPEQMSAERYQRIRQYGGQLDLTPGSESDVILVLERTEEYKKDPRNKILAQFELLPNYRFHRYVTGRSALEAASLHGNGRIAAFVGAPGSAGTLAAGDEIKAQFPDAVVCALEPKECSTLFNCGRGTHRIEGIGDKMVTLIHNVLTTDYVALIHDEDCVMGLDLLECRQPLVERILGMPAGSLQRLRGLFGVSGICNILGAIRMARFLGLGLGDNVVTIATDGFDRYPSVLANLAERKGPTEESWFENIFRGGDDGEILDVRPREQKERLFRYKEEVWSTFHYSQAYLDGMKSQSFWDAEFDKVGAIDEALVLQRGQSVHRALPHPVG